jgi:hypothetical protein
MLSVRVDGPGMDFLVVGVAASVCLAWAGFKAQRKPSAKPSSEALWATLVEPTPATRSVLPEDVIGPWRFYVDAAASTVTIDLQATGHYTQHIVGNRGEAIDGPGGTWTLDGSHLELTSYQSAAQKTIAPARWFFHEGPNDLLLFAKDEPGSERDLLGERVAAE